MEKQRSTTKERMQEVLMVLGVSASEFENKCGLAHGFVARVTREITKKTRIKIKQAYPKLNIDYIAVGVGDIFTEEGETFSTIKDRLRAFLESMHIGRKEFSKKTGVSETLLSNMGDSLRRSSLERIYRAFPMLSPEWLEYGEGEMITEKKEKKVKDTPLDRIGKVVDFLGITTTAFLSETGVTTFRENITKRTIDKIVKRYPFINPLWLMHGTGNMIDSPAKTVDAKFSYAPLVSQRAAAGYLAGFADDDYLDSLEKIPYIEDEEMKGNIVAIEVFGDSMDDGTAEGYRSGDIVLAKEVFLDNIQIRKYDFVIVHKTGILIKRIAKVGKRTITIHSLNKDYGDIELNNEDILKVFVVKMRISKQRH